ncbi:MAG TPA: isochorismatase family cysteine hydrolase [Anaerolineaceae bacterium]
MSENTLAERSQPFLAETERWLSNLPEISMAQAAPHPERAAVVSIDVTNGFCYTGPLSSPRVAGIVQPVRDLFLTAWDHGIRQIVLTQDTHDPQAVEFHEWPPHCVRGTIEAEAVPEIKSLPFFDQILVLPKNSINPGFNTGLEAWLEQHPELDTFIAVGDCTDLCTYQLAMYFRVRANARQQQGVRVIVPANAVDTYDMPVETARAVGALPHPADLMHALFLYHMALNGVEVVRRIGR